MSVSTHRQESTRVTATVSVRVPENTDADLATDAQRRLSAIEAVQTAAVEGFEGIEPRLSATVVTVVVRIESQAAATELRAELSNTVGVEEVQALDQD